MRIEEFTDLKGQGRSWQQIEQRKTKMANYQELFKANKEEEEAEFPVVHGPKKGIGIEAE